MNGLSPQHRNFIFLFSGIGLLVGVLNVFAFDLFSHSLLARKVVLYSSWTMLYLFEFIYRKRYLTALKALLLVGVLFFLVNEFLIEVLVWQLSKFLSMTNSLTAEVLYAYVNHLLVNLFSGFALFGFISFLSPTHWKNAVLIIFVGLGLNFTSTYMESFLVSEIPFEYGYYWVWEKALPIFTTTLCAFLMAQTLLFFRQHKTSFSIKEWLYAFTPISKYQFLGLFGAGYFLLLVMFAGLLVGRAYTLQKSLLLVFQTFHIFIFGSCSFVLILFLKHLAIRRYVTIRKPLGWGYVFLLSPIINLIPCYLLSKDGLRDAPISYRESAAIHQKQFSNQFLFFNVVISLLFVIWLFITQSSFYDRLIFILAGVLVINLSLLYGATIKDYFIWLLVVFQMVAIMIQIFNWQPLSGKIVTLYLLNIWFILYARTAITPRFSSKIIPTYIEQE